MAQTILFVEDNADNALMIQVMLKREGFTVIVAGNGDIGIELALKLQPDLIICDYHLPGFIKGPGFIRAVRDLPAIANTPIIMLTADTTTYPESIEAGASTYLTKPIDREQLLQHIAALL